MSTFLPLAHGMRNLVFIVIFTAGANLNGAGGPLKWIFVLVLVVKQIRLGFPINVRSLTLSALFLMMQLLVTTGTTCAWSATST